MKEIRILVTGVGAFVSDSILRCFKEVKERNIYVVGVDIQEKVSCNNIDIFYQYEKPTSNMYIDRLIEICEKEKVEFIIPLVDSELIVLSNNKEFFKKHNIEVCVNDVNAIKLCQNKFNLYKYLESKNIDVPRAIKFNDKLSFIKACEQLGYPDKIICYKPLISSGTRGFRVIDKDLDWSKYLFQEKSNSKYISYETVLYGMEKCSKIPEMMLMEYVGGDLYNVNVLAKSGKVIYSVAGKVLDFNASNTTKCKILINQEIDEYVKNIVKLLDLNGNVGFEVAYTSDKILKIIEINIRVQGQIYSSFSAGINFPYYELKMHLNEELPQNIEIKEIIVERKLSDYILN